MQPNFFIVGAPKCGTTSLAEWLGGHAEVFMPHVKEPHFFCRDIAPQKPLCPTWADYQRLFVDARPSHRAVGEASVSYLRSRCAIPRIEALCPGSRYIALVRNPVEMALSLHGQRLRSGTTVHADLESDWRAEAVGGPIARDHRRTTLADLGTYAQACALGRQVARLFEIAGRERTMVIVFDDLRGDPAAVYAQVLAFLGLSDDPRTEFPARNSARRVRWPAVHRSLHLAVDLARRAGLPRLDTGLLAGAKSLNETKGRAGDLRPEFRRTLQQHFSEDVRLLGDLLRRDLSHWSDQAPGDPSRAN